jgi:hypothetical protein
MCNKLHDIFLPWSDGFMKGGQRVSKLERELWWASDLERGRGDNQI